MAASRTGNVDAMKVLLDHGANVNAKETLRGTTPLMWAADEGHAAAIKFLIERGADINAHSSSGGARKRTGAREIERSAASRSRRRARRSPPDSASPALGARIAPQRGAARSGGSRRRPAAGERAGAGSGGRRGGSGCSRADRSGRCRSGGVRLWRTAGTQRRQRWRRADAAGHTPPAPTISIP